MRTLHAVPVAVRYSFETYAMGVVGCVAAIAQKKNIFSLCRIANRAWVALFFFVFFGIFAKPLSYIELGNLLLILNIVLGDGGSWKKKEVSKVKQREEDKVLRLNVPSTPL
jgi:hypothetical protein